MRVMSRWTSRTAAIAIRMPLLIVVPNKRGNRSATGKTGVCGTSVVGSRKGILTSTLARLVPRKLIISEVMISLMPYLALRKAGISDHAAPTAKATMSVSVIAMPHGTIPTRTGLSAAAATAASRNWPSVPRFQMPA